MKVLGIQAILLLVFGSIGTLAAFPQSAGGDKQDSPSTETQKKQKTSKHSKKDNKSKGRDHQQSDTPMNERPPVPLPSDRTRPNPPTLPPQTPGEQPAPQSADPTRPTTAQPK